MEENKLIPEINNQPVEPTVQPISVPGANDTGIVNPIVNEVPVTPVAPIVNEVPVTPVAPIVNEVPVAPVAPIVNEVPVTPVAPVVNEVPVAPVDPMVAVSNLNKDEAMEEALSHTNQYSPFEAPKEENQTASEKDDKYKGLIFIIIILVCMALFIVFLPQISKLFGW